MGPGLGQGQRQRAEAGADLDDTIAGSDAGEAGDPAHGVGVGDEVLTQAAAGCRADAVEQGTDRLTRVGHQLISTGTGASARSAITKKASVCITTESRRPAGEIDAVHFTERLLSRLVTVTVAPNGASLTWHTSAECRLLR